MTKIIRTQGVFEEIAYHMGLLGTKKYGDTTERPTLCNIAEQNNQKEQYLADTSLPNQRLGKLLEHQKSNYGQKEPATSTITI